MSWHKLLGDIITCRPDVLEGTFQGDLRVYRVGRDTDPDTLENDPRRFFDVTYPSTSLKHLIHLVREKLTGHSRQGGEDLDSLLF